MNTYLSDEQMNAVHGGVRGHAWELLDLPVGKQPLPDWVTGAHVYWANGVGNAPSVKLKVRGDVFTWDNLRYTKNDDAYMACNSDGRARVYYHTGAVSVIKLKDSRLRGKIPYNDWPEVDVRATTQQDGFGGDNLWLTMDDGEPLVLRGPWHGGAPDGYVEVSCVDIDSSANHQGRWFRNRPWHQRGGVAGLYLTEELFLRIFAKFIPHARLIRINKSYGTRIEPMLAEWEMPKSYIYEIERMRAQQKQPAGRFWRVYWDARGSYCGTLRIPQYGYLDEVPEHDRVYA